MHALTTIRDSLAHVHPFLPWLVLTIATFLAAYLIRRNAPSVWLRFFWWVPASTDARARDAIQAFTVAAPATAISALASGGDVTNALLGLAAGLTAPVVHLVLRAMPVPYQGALGSRLSSDLAARPDAAEKRYGDPPTTLLLVLAVLAATHGATACASVPARGPCSAEERGKLTAIYLAELAAYCAGKGESCPYLPEIDARHEARRKEWVSCQP